MPPHWDFYFCRLNDHLASVFLDLGYGQGPPPAGLTTLVYVFVPMRQARPDGLSSREEADRLAALEDALVPALVQGLPAAFVARATTRGHREFYFYAQDPGRLGELLAAVFTDFSDYRCEHGTRPDPEWSHYREVLFPAPVELQLMHNRHVLEQLRERGDDGSRARPLRHHLYFPDWKSRIAFSQWAAPRGYRCEDLPPRPEPVADKPFGLVLHHVAALPLEGINAIVSELFAQAETGGGEYDGWETEVVQA